MCAYEYWLNYYANLAEMGKNPDEEDEKNFGDPELSSDPEEMLKELENIPTDWEDMTPPSENSNG